ncbi:MAG: DUF547 domain-containing protein [Pseudomonadota bacterium]
MFYPSRILKVASIVLAVSLAAAQPVWAQLKSDHDPSAAPSLQIDYEVFDIMLEAVVFEVGRSDRRPARTRTRRTGTRISLENPSRYRYEGNRVSYHLLDDDQKAQIHAYREDLEALPERIDFSRLSANEELAYWLNLHNIVVIDELARRYPVRRLRRVEIDGHGFWDSPIVDVGARRISLNQIRFEIVGQRWRDPRIMYGFFSGAVGGPTLQGEAFKGARVWRQLDANAREFVNALRGVESSSFGFRVSPLYEEWSQTLFPVWPEDLRAHLASYAETGVYDALAIGGEPDLLTFDDSIADVTNGIGRCGGTGALNVVSYGESGAPSFVAPCSDLPAHAQTFVDVVIERRLELLRRGRVGSVTIRDLPTEDRGINLRPARRSPSSEANSPDAP